MVNETRQNQLEDLRSEAIPTAALTRFDIEFHLFQEDTRLSGYMSYAKELGSEPATVHNLARHLPRDPYGRGLEQPTKPISILTLNDGFSKDLA